MTQCLRGGIAQKKEPVTLSGVVECEDAYVVAGRKGQPGKATRRVGGG